MPFLSFLRAFGPGFLVAVVPTRVIMLDVDLTHSVRSRGGLVLASGLRAASSFSLADDVEQLQRPVCCDPFRAAHAHLTIAIFAQRNLLKSLAS